MKNAGIYVRISHDRAGEALGVKRQEDDCRALCERLGWNVHEVYVDNDVSAYSGRARPAYQRLLDDLKGATIDAVVCWHPDRLHRSPRELEDFIDVIDVTGAQVATVTAGDFDLGTPEGRLVARITGSVARKESEDKSRRALRKHAELAAAGRASGGGCRPFGFQADRHTIDVTEAALVREAAQRLLAGEALRSVVVDWDQRGVCTVSGRPWRTVVLRRLVTSGRVCGWREHRGALVTKATWPPIVDRATVERLRALLLDPDRRASTQPPRRYLLTGLAVCGLCGARLVARPRADKRRCYVCASGPCAGCGKIRILAEPFEDFVGRQVLHRLSHADAAGQLVDVDPAIEHDLMAEVEVCEAKLGELAASWAQDRLSRAEWLAARQAVEGRLSAARRRLVAAQPAATAMTAQAGVLVPAWPSMTILQQRPIVAAFVDEVTVEPAVRGLNRFDHRRVSVRWVL